MCLCTILFGRKASSLTANSFLVEIAAGNPYRTYQNPESMGMAFIYIQALIFKHNNYFLIPAIIMKIIYLAIYFVLGKSLRWLAKPEEIVCSFRKGAFLNNLLVQFCHAQNTKTTGQQQALRCNGSVWFCKVTA